MLLTNKTAVVYGAGGELAAAAVFAASDRANAMSVTILNVTCGSIMDQGWMA